MIEMDEPGPREDSDEGDAAPDQRAIASQLQASLTSGSGLHILSIGPDLEL